MLGLHPRLAVVSGVTPREGVQERLCRSFALARKERMTCQQVVCLEYERFKEAIS